MIPGFGPAKRGLDDRKPAGVHAPVGEDAEQPVRGRAETVACRGDGHKAPRRMLPSGDQGNEHGFGLGGKEEMTQKDVADELGISQSYISRLEKKIIERLKKEISKLV